MLTSDMNTTDLVQLRRVEVPTLPAARGRALAPSRHELATPVRNRIIRARQFFVGRQRLDGSWAGERSGDVVSLSQLVLLHAYLGHERSELVEQAARAIRREQHAEGGWALTPGGPIDASVSVRAYFALKIAGVDPSLPTMRRAREAIRACGGADAADTATRFWLALLGQVDYDCCPSIAPERLLTPAGPENLTATEEQRWAALSVVSALRPVRTLAIARGVRELFVLSPKAWPTPHETGMPQESAALKRLWSWCERIGWLPFRRKALDLATSRLVAAAVGIDRYETNLDELAWRWVALSALGFAETSPALAACECQLKQLVVVDAELDEARSQSDTSLTADTALALESLHASGLGVAHPAVAAGIGWLVKHRLRMVREHRNPCELASMLRLFSCLEAGNESASSNLPPDLRISGGGRARHAHAPSTFRHQVVEELHSRFMAEQNSDGGWSVRRMLVADLRRCGAIRSVDHCPTAESSPVATGAMLETLSSPGQASAATAIRRAADYLRFSQHGDGSWGRAGDADSVHATTWSVRGLVAAGAKPDGPAIAAGVNWLLVRQQESGGWGEADGSAIQTAWAVLALVVAGQADHDATRRAIRFLVDTQQDDGTWSDPYPSERDSATGDWHRNDLYAAALPTLALSNWAVAIASELRDRPAALRLVYDESPH